MGTLYLIILETYAIVSQRGTDTGIDKAQQQNSVSL